jgi:hypothetical protein
MRRIVVIAMGISLGLSAAASAQENRSEISLQGGGLFTRSTMGNGTSYSTTESGGVLGTYRYHLNRWISVEGAYGYSVNTQKYSLSSSAFRIQRLYRKPGLESSLAPELAYESVLAGWRRSTAFRSYKRSVQYSLGRSGPDEGSIRIWSGNELRDLQGPITPCGVSRARLQYP